MDADDGFPILEDISDEQALDRLEQLLDASNDLPDLDSGVLVGSESHGVSSSVDGLDFGQELFSTPSSNASNNPTPHYASLPSPGGPLLNQKMSYPGGPGSVGSQPPPSPMQQQSPMHHHMQSPAASSVPPSPAQFAAPSPASHCPQSPGSSQLSMKSPQPLPPPSPANILYAKSPASHPPPPSPGLRSAPTPGPPVLSPQPASIQSQPPTPGSIYSAPSPTHPNILMGHSIAPGTVLTSHQLGMPNMQHLQLQPTQPMFQIQIQPNVSMQGLTASSQATKLQPVTSQPVPITPNKGKQPQLLPKPAQATSNSPQSSRPGGRPTMQPPAITTLTTVSGQQPIIINQAGVITTMAQNSPVLMGQMMPGTGSTPFFIQQQSGAPLMIMRPNAPTLQGTPTLVPLQQSAVSGQQTIYLQQAPQPGSLITNQPQVKLITPQGRMQMQQIQTPAGPKFIAVPIGQTLLPGQNIINPSGSNMQLTPTLTASGQIQFQATPNISLSSTPILTNTSQAYTLQVTQAGNPPLIQTTFTSATSSNAPKTSSYLQSSGGGVTTVVSSLQGTYPVTSSNQIAGQSVIQSSQNALDIPQQQSTPVSPSKKKKSKKKRRDPRDESPPKSSTVDLGALMKDVGLDIGDGFGMDDDFGMDSESVLVSESSQNSSSLNSSHDSTSSSTSDPPQIISSMPITSLGGAPLQIQTTIPQIAPIATQLAAPQFVTSQLGGLAPQQLRLAAPQLMTPQLTASSSLQLVQGPDGQFILQTNPAPGIISQPVGVDTASAALSNPAQVQTVPQDNASSAPSPSQKSSPRAPVRPRPMPDPSRTPLFEDDTLPQGWHRKVSQRKSGASAGRYEVFIIGPTQKRFRSRNELKNFFEKTGETTLNPDDFDFSTFGRNNPKGPTSSSSTVSISTLGQSNPSITPTFSVASAAPTYSVPTASVTSSSVIVTTSPILPVTMPSSVQGSLSRSNLPPTSTITSLPTTSTATPAVSAQEYDLIKNLQRDLEVTGMASVAAAKALEGTANQILPPTRNLLLQNIQQPLPPSSLAGHSLPPASLAGPGIGLQVTLPTPSTHQPPISRQVAHLTPLQTSVVPHPSALSPTTPSTAGIQDADDQISRLLITMQQQTGSKLPDEDKVNAFIQSLTESGESKLTFPNVQSPTSRLRHQSGGRNRSPGRSPGPPLSRSPVPPFAPTIRSQGGTIPRSVSPGPPTMRPHSPGPLLSNRHRPGSGLPPEGGVPSPSMPVLTPQISLPTSSSKPQDTTFQNSYLDSLSKSQISDPKKSRLRNSSGLQSLGSPAGNMPMLSPTTGILHSPSSHSESASPSLPAQSHIVNKSSVIQGPGGGNFGVIQQVPRSESQPAPSMAAAVISGPPNVTVHASVPQPNLLGGPGSQIRALQHLPPNTRLVRGPNGQVTLQKIQTIELTQEMQATFRAVATRIAEIERQAVKTPQDESDLARLYSKQQQILSAGRPVPTTQQPPNVPVTQPHVPTPMSTSLPKPDVPIRYTHTVGKREIPVVPVGPAGPVLPPTAIPLPLRPTSSSASVPPLTDQQKRIVAEFKSKIATLPPDQQQTYIAQNKLNLIKQLNFQPSQLQALQGTRPVAPPRPLVPPQIPVVHGDRPPANMAPPNLHPIKPPPPPQALNPPTLVPQGVSLPIIPVPVEIPDRARPAMCPAINKSKKIAWVESQIKKDQQEAVNPNFKTPFRSKEDACKRLLRYHVFDDTDSESADFDQLDEDFEIKSQFLLTKYQAMHSRYHFLLLQESTRQVSSSEEVMLGRQWVAAEKQDLAKEKEELTQINNRLDELRALESRTEEQIQEETELLNKLKPDFPGVPNSWSEKFQEVMGRPLRDELNNKEDKSDDEDTVRWDNSDGEDENKSNSTKEESIKPNNQKDEKEAYAEDSEIKWVNERCRQDSGNKLKGVRVSLTNVMNQRGVKRELEETGTLISPSPRPDSMEPPTSPEDSHHIGLKFNRTMSGRWSAQLKQEDSDDNDDDDDYDEFSAMHNHLPGFPRSGQEGGSVYSGSPLFEPPSKILRKSNESDDDQDFSLADVAGSSAAVGYLVDDLNDDVDLRFNSPSAASLERFGSATPSRFGVDCATPNLDSEPADNDSVQNAINSILDLPDRGGVQTPDDLNNLTGLLDSMESDEVDPSLDAAVASMQGLM